MTDDDARSRAILRRMDRQALARGQQFRRQLEAEGLCAAKAALAAGLPVKTFTTCGVTYQLDAPAISKSRGRLAIAPPRRDLLDDPVGSDPAKPSAAPPPSRSSNPRRTRRPSVETVLKRAKAAGASRVIRDGIEYEFDAPNAAPANEILTPEQLRKLI